MADRLSPCVLSGRFALCSFSDDISLPVCVSMCVCSSVCICAQLGSSFKVSASFEHFFVYCTVNHEGLWFIAFTDRICVHTGTCLFTHSDYSRRLQEDRCAYPNVLTFHVPFLVCLHLCE